MTQPTDAYQAISGPTDDQLIRHILLNPGTRLHDLCRLCYVPYRNGDHSAPEVEALRSQLQRLRRAGKLQTTQGQRWEVREI